MSKFKMTRLVIKPILRCTANCSGCESRQDLHKSLRREQVLTLDEWKWIFEDAAQLGVQRLDISGGEPTLYRQLLDLVKFGRLFHWQVNVNTNGTFIKSDNAKLLVDAGLNSVYVSLYGSTSQLHDAMRYQRGLWDKATNAIQLFSLAGVGHSDFSVKVQTLICKSNFREIPKLISLSHQLGAKEIAISYLEGDFFGKLQLTPADIQSFRKEIIPDCLAAISDLPLGVQEKNKAMEDVRQLFSENLSIEQWASSIYRPNEEEKCDRPQWFSLILANGDVHPCNMVEYTHAPIMGNVRMSSLGGIWNNESFKIFREKLFDCCKMCPINLYTVIPLR
jgi:pyrroloquinoline quinone biosynthesis protein E